ncbi:MAG: class II SORL domain-containing protein [Sulfolobales archaeon]
MKKLGELIYTTEESYDAVVLSKAEYHLPKIVIPEQIKAGEPFKVKITVGPHPNTTEHYIKRIELYFNEEGRAFNPILLAYIDLTPIYSQPEVEFTIKLSRSGSLHAVEYCTLHGLWETTKEVKVL